MTPIKCPYCGYGGEDPKIGRRMPGVDVVGVPRIICSNCKREFVVDELLVKSPIAPTVEGVKASDCKCVDCGERAVAFYPITDPDIPEHPYCRKCLDKRKTHLLHELFKIRNEVKNNG